MSPKSLLFLENFKKPSSSCKSFSTTPELIGYFTTDWKNEMLSEDIEALKYFCTQNNGKPLENIYLNFMEMKSLAGKSYSLKEFNEDKEEPVIPFSNWLEQKMLIEKKKKPQRFVTFKNVLSNILNIPFAKDKRFTIIAFFKSNDIYLVPNIVNSLPSPADFQNDSKENNIFLHKVMKNGIFLRKPHEFFQKTYTILDKHFYGVYQLESTTEHHTHQIVYSGEIAGVQYNDGIVENLEDLKSTEIFETDIIKNQKKYNAVLFNYNPKWWSQIFLSQAKQFLIGFVNDENEFYEMKKIPVEKLSKFGQPAIDNEDEYDNFSLIHENTSVTECGSHKLTDNWSPEIGLNFLNDFLTFIKYELDRCPTEERNRYRWIFEVRPNGKSYVSCEPVIDYLIVQ